jgi:hypothetical protein
MEIGGSGATAAPTGQAREAMKRLTIDELFNGPTRRTVVGAIWPIGVVERDVIAELREIARDEGVTQTVRREAREALKIYQRKEEGDA